MNLIGLRTHWRGCLGTSIVGLAVYAGMGNMRTSNAAGGVLPSRVVNLELKARSKSVVAGREAWFELIFHNNSKAEQLLPVNGIRIRSIGFASLKRHQGSASARPHEVTAPALMCSGSIGPVKLPPGSSMVRLVRIEIPEDVAGGVQMHVAVELSRIVDLATCTIDTMNIDAVIMTDVVER